MSKLNVTIVFLMILLIGCGPTKNATVSEDNVEVSRNIQQGTIEYIPIDPVTVHMVEYYDVEKDSVKISHWRALDDSLKRSLLPIQSAEVSVKKLNYGSSVEYIGSSLSGEKGIYSVVMDYMKYRVEPIEKSSQSNDTETLNDSLMVSTESYIGNAKVGIGLRIKANVETFKTDLNLGSLMSLGVQANAENLKGSISVDVIGIDSKDVTNLIPLTSEIDQTSIQSALQALASIKTKIYDTETLITPHIVAITNTTEDKKDEALQKFTE